MSRDIAEQDLILKIYDTVADPASWPSMLDEISHYLNAQGAFIFEMEGFGDDRLLRAPYFSTGYSLEAVSEYLRLHTAQELRDQDRFAYHSKAADGLELIRDEVLADSEEELLARANTQMMIRFGLRYRAGALLNKDQIYQDRFALQFSESHGPLSDEERARAHGVMPHIAKALSVGRPSLQLDRKFSSVASMVDHLKVGVCVLDARGQVVFANVEFKRQMEHHRAFRIEKAGRLRFSEAKFDKSLQALFGDLSNHGKFGGRPRKEAVSATLEDDTFALCIEVVPLDSAPEFGETNLEGHIVYSLDTSVSYDIKTDILTRLFALTRSEADVLELMADGLTNQQISEARGKSIHTINSQVKSVLAKTRTANRTQLIRMATNVSANFLAN